MPVLPQPLGLAQTVALPLWQFRDEVAAFATVLGSAGRDHYDILPMARIS